jgi:hypothetical protein
MADPPNVGRAPWRRIGNALLYGLGTGVGLDRV